MELVRKRGLSVLGKILVAEDNAMVRDSFCHVLRRRGYDVLEAENGEVALKIIESADVDLAIVDVMMPTMGGLELRQAIDGTNRPVPTILITGVPDLVAGLVKDDPDFQMGM